MRSLKDKAIATAALFDANEQGWAKKITLDSFSMDCLSTCMLGQLYGDFYSKSLPAFLNAPPPDENERLLVAQRDAWGFEHGLTCRPESDDDESIAQWDELTKIWTELINERLAVPAAFTPAT